MGFLRPFSEPAPPPHVFTPEQLRRMATKGLKEDAEGDAEDKASMQTLAGEDGEVSEEEEQASQAAVIAAAQKEGGTLHKDDNYVPLENAPGPRYPPTHDGQDLDVIQYGDYPADYGSHTSKRLRNQDTIVPVTSVQMSMFPLLNLQDGGGINDHDQGEPGKPITANIMFGKTLEENGLGDGKYVETVSGGLGANSEPPIDRVYDELAGGNGLEDDGTLSRVMLWALVLFVLVGGVVMLGYNLLPPGSFSRVWKGDGGGDDDGEFVDDGKWTRAYYEPPAGQAPGYTAMRSQV